MSMWLQPSPCLDTTVPSSTNEGDRKMVDGVAEAEYAQKRKEKGFSVNMKIVLTLPGSLATPKDTLWTQRSIPSSLMGAKMFKMPKQSYNPSSGSEHGRANRSQFSLR